MFSKFLDLFCWGLNLIFSVSYSHRVYSLVGIGWHIEKMIKLACVNANNRFTNICWIPDKSLIDYSLTCENNRRTSNHIFSNLLQQVFIGLSKKIEFGTGRFVETNIRQKSEVYTRASTCQFLSCDKKQAFFALLPVSGPRFCCCISVESL